MKKKFLVLLFIMLMIFSVIGCTKCINTEYESVEVTIIDEYYKATWVQPVITGKTPTLITHPAKYRITVEYNGNEYKFTDSDTYDKYKDKIGQTVSGTLEIRTYDDGTTGYDIISLE